jgi:hypothetical protein
MLAWSATSGLANAIPSGAHLREHGSHDHDPSGLDSTEARDGRARRCLPTARALDAAQAPPESLVATRSWSSPHSTAPMTIMAITSDTIRARK